MVHYFKYFQSSYDIYSLFGQAIMFDAAILANSM